MDRAEEIIRLFGLRNHPEGGFYRRTYVSDEVVAFLPARFGGERPLSSAIYYLLTSDDFSSFHSLSQDEIWHFYEGSSLIIHIIKPSGKNYSLTLGNDYPKGETPQAVIPAGSYFAASVTQPDSYSFVGCTLSPAFDFADLAIAKRDELLVKFPQHRRLIMEYTRV